MNKDELLEQLLIEQHNGGGWATEALVARDLSTDSATFSHAHPQGRGIRVIHRLGASLSTGSPHESTGLSTRLRTERWAASVRRALMTAGHRHKSAPAVLEHQSGASPTDRTPTDSCRP